MTRTDHMVEAMLDELATTVLEAGGMIPPFELRFYSIDQFLTLCAENNIQLSVRYVKPYGIKFRELEERIKKDEQ